MNKEITIEQVKEFIETSEEGKKLVQSLIDSNVTKGIDTWKQNNLDEEVTKRVSELYPEEDPKDAEIKKLSLALKEMENKTLISGITKEAMQVATDKKLPADIVKLLVTKDADETNSNIEAFESVWTTALKEQIKGSVHSSKPESSDNKFVDVEFKDMSYQDKKELKQNDPDLYNSLTK